MSLSPRTLERTSRTITSVNALFINVINLFDIGEYYDLIDFPS